MLQIYILYICNTTYHLTKLWFHTLSTDVELKLTLIIILLNHLLRAYKLSIDCKKIHHKKGKWKFCESTLSNAFFPKNIIFLYSCLLTFRLVQNRFRLFRVSTSKIVAYVLRLMVFCCLFIGCNLRSHVYLIRRMMT